MSEKLKASDIAKMIDHSLLHPVMTDRIIKEGCELAKKYNVAAACVKPYSVTLANELLADSEVNICSVIGFPHGNSCTEIKVKETELAVSDGSTEIDMVVNIGKTLGEQWSFVKDEIRAINDTCNYKNVLLKVIFETDFLEDKYIIKLCEICSSLNVAFVKTSTGYGFTRQPNGMYNYNGATIHHIKLMRQYCAPNIRIKAAGGIRTLDDALAFAALGVTRIGATATKDIVEEAEKRENLGILKLPDPSNL